MEIVIHGNPIQHDDEKSRPIRDAAMSWCRRHDLGCCQRWDGYAWQIDIFTRPVNLRVEVCGSVLALVHEQETRSRSRLIGKARTPCGLRRVLDRMLKQKGLNRG